MWSWQWRMTNTIGTLLAQPRKVSRLRALPRIGMFIAWAATRGLLSFRTQMLAAPALEQLSTRRITGRTFLLDHCDGSLGSDDFSSVGAAFANAYYSEHFFNDYAAALTSDDLPVYGVADSWDNFEKEQETQTGKPRAEPGERGSMVQRGRPAGRGPTLPFWLRREGPRLLRTHTDGATTRST
jgi:hypothetical protein